MCIISYMITLEETLEELKKQGFKITATKYSIIKYLIGNRVHPDAMTIFNEVKKEYPSLSFATVYNTLNTLEKLGMVKRLAVFKQYANYDINTETHHHFICKECGKIYDLLDGNDIGVSIKFLSQHKYKIEDISLNLYGICEKCRGN